MVENSFSGPLESAILALTRSIFDIMGNLRILAIFTPGPIAKKQNGD